MDSAKEAVAQLCTAIAIHNDSGEGSNVLTVAKPDIQLDRTTIQSQVTIARFPT
jgi:hypothetical protein